MNQIVDVDSLWEAMRKTIGGLQAAGRLPGDAHIFDPRHEIIIRYLKDHQPQLASAEAWRIAKGDPPGLFAILTTPPGNPAGAFAAYELLKHYYLATDQPTEAAQVARAAATHLAAAERRLQRQRKKGTW